LGDESIHEVYEVTANVIVFGYGEVGMMDAIIMMKCLHLGVREERLRHCDADLSLLT
jgi:hypothetical protein